MGKRIAIIGGGFAGTEAAPGPRFASTVQPQQTGLLAQADLTQF